MTGGKDEEKIMGPMFPRLHVNDTEKGGPRAPPRNKMALYEQLSIPSQRYSHGVLPLKTASNASNLVPSSSSVQGGRNERGSFFPRQPPTRHQVEKPYTQYADMDAPLLQVEQKKKSEEDDFMVPIFIHSRPSHEQTKYFNEVEREKLPPSYPAYPSNPMKFQKDKQMGVVEHSTRQEAKQKEENVKEFVANQDQLVKAISNSSSTNRTGGLQKQADASLCYEPMVGPDNSNVRLRTDYRIQPGIYGKSQPTTSVHGNAVLNKHGTAIAKGNSSTSKKDYPLEEQNVVHKLTNDTGTHEDRQFWPPRLGNIDRCDSASETSMVDSISGLDISPDDVVGVLGQKHFWKARRAIASQQKVFAVQVFELHRLIKVQRSIAGSPHLLLEDASAYLSKAVKAPPVKKLPLDYNAKVPIDVSKRKSFSEKPSQMTECSAENMVEKASVSSVQYDVQPSSDRPFLGNPAAPSVGSDNSFGPWCYNQPNGHQWLIPVMSPSEGLVYKPYPGPGFMGQGCGGYAPPGSTPVMGNILTPAYGVPAAHHQYHLPSFTPAPHNGYFPPYGIPVMNPAFSGSSVEQADNHAVQGQSSAKEANPSSQHQHSFHMPAQKIRAIPNVARLLASKDSELQGSTASSSSERPQISVAGSTMEGRSMLPLFPTSPSNEIPVPDCSPQPPESECPVRVIKVVPHNARSATESAARIFKSIQEERKQYDSV